MHDSSEHPAVAKVHLADRQVHGKDLAVLSEALYFSPDANDPGFTHLEVVGQVVMMLAEVRFRHQHADLLAEGLFGRIAEDSVGRAIEGSDLAVLIDGNDALCRGIEDGAESLLIVSLGLFGPRLVCHRLPHNHESVGHVPSSRDPGNVPQHDALGTVAGQDRVLVLPDELSGQCPPGVGRSLLSPGFREQKFEAALAEDLIPRPAEHRLRLAVPFCDAEFRRDADDHAGGSIDERSKSIFALPQCRSRPSERRQPGP